MQPVSALTPCCTFALPKRVLLMSMQVVLRDLPGILDQRMPGSIDKKAVWDAAGECHVLLLVMDVHKLVRHIQGDNIYH